MLNLLTKPICGTVLLPSARCRILILRIGLRLTGAATPSEGFSIILCGAAAGAARSGGCLRGGLPFQVLSLIPQRFAKLSEARMIRSGKARCQSKGAICLIP